MYKCIYCHNQFLNPIYNLDGYCSCPFCEKSNIIYIEKSVSFIEQEKNIGIDKKE